MVTPLKINNNTINLPENNRAPKHRKGRSITNTKSTEKVAKAVNGFLNKNGKRINERDGLKKNSDSLKEGKKFQKISSSSPNVEEKGKNLPKKLLGFNHLPVPLRKLTENYCGIADAFQLSLIGELSEPLNTYIAAANQEIIVQFLKDVRTIDHTSHFFTEIIRLFFQNTSPEQHGWFFCNMDPNDGQFLSNVISALPEDMTRLNLQGCRCLTPQNISELQRLTQLEELVFANTLCAAQYHECSFIISNILCKFKNLKRFSMFTATPNDLNPSTSVHLWLPTFMSMRNPKNLMD